jgi:hypothetical protein|tara:strand:- start:149 stop:820 length:672 start_codon:yes stop_codon:yes gene_type:complete
MGKGKLYKFYKSELRTFKKILILLFISIQACSEDTPEENVIRTKIRVNFYTELCTGIILQQCYLIQENDNIGGNDWQLFYDLIEGFDYVPGYIYDLDVSINEVDDPPADTSSLRYTLNRILSKTNIESFSGKLIKQGICMNYVIQVNNIYFPQDLIEKKWVDESSQIEYENVFTLESVCDFPESIKEGDSFSFIIDNEKKNQCAVCSAYSHVPEKSVSITVGD